MTANFKRPRRLTIVLATLAAAAILVGAITLRGQHARSSNPGEPGQQGPQAPGALAGEREAVAVSVGPITLRPVQRTVGAVGSFYGYDEVTVMAEVTGRVAAVYHDVGDLVEPGEDLLKIDPTDYQLVVEETRRALELDAARIGIDQGIRALLDKDGPALEAACARIGLALPPDHGFDPEKVLSGFDINYLPTVVRAEKQMANAKDRLDRAKELRDRRSISQEEFDERATTFEVAQTNWLQAKFDAAAVVAGIRHRLVLLKIANRKLELTTVKVPMPTERERMPAKVQYAVVDRKVTEGEMLKDAAGASTATFELVMDGVLKLKADVPERFAAEVQPGQKAEVRVDAYPDRVFPGEVIRINPMIDRTNRTFQVEVYVDNPTRELKAGGFAKVAILTHVDPQAWTVPEAAIVSFAGSTKLFVVRDGLAHVVPVAKGLEGPGWVELIRSFSPDLRLDDQVITSGQANLAEGVAVRVRG